MIELIDLHLPNIVTDSVPVFRAHMLSAVRVALAWAAGSDPLVLNVPRWWTRVPLAHKAAADKFSNPIRAEWLDEDGYFLDAIAAVGAKELSQPAEARPRGKEDGDLPRAVRDEFFDVIREVSMDRDSKATAEEERWDMYLTFARAAEAGRLGGVNMFAPDRLSKASRTLDVISRVLVGLGGPVETEATMSAMTSTLLVKDPGGLWDPRVAESSSQSNAFAELIWLGAFKPLMESSYLTNLPSHADDRAAERDKSFRRLVRARRIETAWWRCGQELRLYVLRQLACLVYTDHTRRYLAAKGMGEMVNEVETLLKRPQHGLLEGIQAWSRPNPGQTPYATTGPRLIAESGIALALEKASTPHKNGGEAGANRMLALAGVAETFTLAAFNYAQGFRRMESRSMLALAEAEKALGLGQPVPGMGRLSPPYGTSARMVFTTGEGWSESDVTLADLVGAYKFPARVITTDGDEKGVGIGPGAMRLLAAVSTGRKYDAQGSEGVIPPRGAHLEPSAMLTLARLGIEWKGSPFMWMEPDVPEFALPAHSFALPLASLRPPEEFQGSSDPQWLRLGSTHERVKAELEGLLPDVTEAELESWIATLDDAITEERERRARFSKRTNSMLGNPAMNPVISYSKGKLTPNVPKAFFDDASRKPWHNRAFLNDIPFVWDVGANPIMVLRPDQITREKPTYALALRTSLTGHQAPYDAASLARSLSLAMAKVLFPVRVG